MLQAYQDEKIILAENKASLEKVAALLLKQEVIYQEDLENILGKRGTAFPAIDLKVETLS